MLGIIVLFFYTILKIVGITCLFITIVALSYPWIIVVQEWITGKGNFLVHEMGVKKIYFFTPIRQRVIKSLVDKGDHIREILINDDESKFQQTGLSESSWEILERKSDEPRMLPSNLKEWYREYVRSITGLWFIGLYPLRQIGVHEIEKNVLPKGTNIAHKNVLLTVETSMTDHLRRGLSQWMFQANMADAAGLISFLQLDVRGFLMIRCDNPYEALMLDSWSKLITNTILAIVRDEIRMLNINDIIAFVTEKDKERKEEKKRRIYGHLEAQIWERLKERCKKKKSGSLIVSIGGHEIQSVEIAAIESQVDPRLLERLSSTIFAEQQGEANLIIADKEVQGWSLRLKQIEKDPENMRFLIEQEVKGKFAMNPKGSAYIFEEGGRTASSALEKKLMLVAEADRAKENSDKE